MSQITDPQHFIDLQKQFGANHYAPKEVVFSAGRGCVVTTVDHRVLLDMMGGYGAIPYHCHPRIVEAIHTQCSKLMLSSNAVYNDMLPLFLKAVCEFFSFDEALMMNSGTEANEAAIKIARKWAYTVKGVEANCAEIIMTEGCFNGRSIAVISSAPDDPDMGMGYGPFLPGIKVVPFGDADALEAAITPNTAAFLVEPIQGEGGVIIPSEDYHPRVREICTKNNVLLLHDEIQSGTGRIGLKRAGQFWDVVPDMMTLAKAIGFGFPISIVLARKDVMDVLTPGTHGSTFGGNPVAAAVGLEALPLLEKVFIPNVKKVENIFLRCLMDLDNNPLVTKTRFIGGLWAGIDFSESVNADTFCSVALRTSARHDDLDFDGIFVKSTDRNGIRLSPPLCIEESQIRAAFSCLQATLDTFN